MSECGPILDQEGKSKVIFKENQPISFDFEG